MSVTSYERFRLLRAVYAHPWVRQLDAVIEENFKRAMHKQSNEGLRAALDWLDKKHCREM